MPLDNQTPLTAQIKKPEVAPAPVSPSMNPSADVKHSLEDLLSAIAKYKTFGKALKRDCTLSEIGMQLAQIAEMAEQAVVSEADDWFDAHTLKRNMKEIKNYTGDFVKLAKEADMINQRMSALYEDMGRVLERYFEIPDGESTEDVTGSDNTVPATAPSREQVPMKEDAPVRTEDFLLQNPSEPALPTPEEEGKTEKTDLLTLRAIKAVHERLKKNNPAAAKKFASLPPARMKEVVWRLVM